MPRSLPQRLLVQGIKIVGSIALIRSPYPIVQRATSTVFTTALVLGTGERRTIQMPMAVLEMRVARAEPCSYSGKEVNLAAAKGVKKYEWTGLLRKRTSTEF